MKWYSSLKVLYNQSWRLASFHGEQLFLVFSYDWFDFYTRRIKVKSTVCSRLLKSTVSSRLLTRISCGVNQTLSIVKIYLTAWDSALCEGQQVILDISQVFLYSRRQWHCVPQQRWSDWWRWWGRKLSFVDGGLEVTTRLKCQWQMGCGKIRVLECCWQATHISGVQNRGWWARFLKWQTTIYQHVWRYMFFWIFKFMPGLFSPFQDFLVPRKMEQGPHV